MIEDLEVQDESMATRIECNVYPRLVVSREKPSLHEHGESLPIAKLVNSPHDEF